MAYADQHIETTTQSVQDTASCVVLVKMSQAEFLELDEWQDAVNCIGDSVVDMINQLLDNAHGIPKDYVYGGLKTLADRIRYLV